jgi:alanine dehydrogenase
MVMHVKEPLLPEYDLIREGQIVFTYLHLAAVEELTHRLIRSGTICIAYETIQKEDGSLPPTHANPTYIVDDSVHYCVANMPGAVAKTSTLALTNATLPYAVEIANKGWEKAMRENPEIKLGADVVKDKITYKGVAEAFNLEYTSI